MAIIGAGLGYGLGTLAPDYYRSLLGGWSPGFDPVSVGVGLGLTQGMAGGVVVGLAVVALLCWRETRLQRGSAQPLQAGSQPAKSRSVVRWLLLVTGLLLSFGFCLSSGVIVGLLGGERGAYHRRYLQERAAVEPALAGDPAFAEVQVGERSDGGVYLLGEVPTPADMERLGAVVTHAIGERRAKVAMCGVGVKR